MRKRRVVILGATGSIGESARKVARDIPERMEIVGMSAHSNADKLHAAAKEFPNAKLAISSGPDGVERLVELATLPEADLVLIAIVGTGGLRPALAAIEAGKDIAVASKEILVMAGEAVMTAARRKGVKVLPVDSEHNAIFQCLEAAKDEGGRMKDESSGPAAQSASSLIPHPSSFPSVRRLILTASGVLALSDDGHLVLIDTNAAAYKELARAHVLDGKCWTTPVLANGKVFARSTKEAVCLDLGH